MDDLFRAGQACRRSEIRIDADEDGSKANKGMKRSNQLWHAGHFNALCHNQANHRPDGNHGDEPSIISDLWPENGGADRQCHADDAKPYGALGAFLIGQPTKRENEENAGCDIDRCNDISAHVSQLSCNQLFLEHGQHPAGHHEAAYDVDRCDQHRDGCKDHNDLIARPDLQKCPQNDNA